MPAASDPSAVAAGEFRAHIQDWLAANLPIVLAQFPKGTPIHDLAVRRAWEDHFCKAGWSGLGWAKEAGGKALPLELQAIFHEEYARSMAPLPLNAIAHGILGP